MSVYQSKSGRWYYKFVIRGKQFHKAIPEATSKRDAEKAEIRIKSELLQGKFDFVENKGAKPFSVISELFKEYAKNNRRGWRNDFAMVKNLEIYFNPFQIKDITPSRIEAYRKNRDKLDKVKPATINREVGIMRRMFALAIKEGLTDYNPCLAANIKPLMVDNIKERFLTTKEEKLLLGKCIGENAYIKPMVICSLRTGMRVGEILSLKWQDNIDFKNACINLLKTKNNKVRKIPIGKELFSILEDLYNSKTSEFVFTNPKTGTGYYGVKKAFARVCKDAKIKNFTFHALRHTAATRMVAAGVDLVVVKEILGHADLKTTQRYAHPVPERKLKAIEALENYSD